MIQEADAAIADPSAVGVYSHDAGIAAESAVLRPGRHDSAAGLTVREFAHLRHLSAVLVQSLFLLFVEVAFQLLKLKVSVVLPDYELARRCFVAHLNVLHDGLVQALQNVLLAQVCPVNVVQIVELFRCHQLRLQTCN